MPIGLQRRRLGRRYSLVVKIEFLSQAHHICPKPSTRVLLYASHCVSGTANALGTKIVIFTFVKEPQQFSIAVVFFIYKLYKHT